MATDIDICAQSLLRLAETPISSFTQDDSDAATICANLYPSFKRTILTLYKWRITMRKRQLSRLSETPLNEWNYAYQLPSDMMSLKAVMTSLNVNSPETTDYEVFGRELHTNEEVIVVEYQIEVDEDQWPPYIEELAKLAFTALIAPAVTDQVSSAEKWEIKAFGTPAERGQGGYFATAKAIDAQGVPAQVIDNYTLVEVRN